MQNAAQCAYFMFLSSQQIDSCFISARRAKSQANANEIPSQCKNSAQKKKKKQNPSIEKATKSGTIRLSSDNAFDAA